MSTEQVTTTSATSEVIVASHVHIHPLSPLTTSEIRTTAGLVRRLYSSTTKFQFKTITLEEPEKARLVPYLEAEHNGQRLPKMDRKAFVCYYLRNTVSQALHPWHAFAMLLAISRVVAEVTAVGQDP